MKCLVALDPAVDQATEQAVVERSCYKQVEMQQFDQDTIIEQVQTR
jgi:hypothetical protein